LQKQLEKEQAERQVQYREMETQLIKLTRAQAATQPA
jgi:hypothetical protein